MVEDGAGEESGFRNTDYQAAGAFIARFAPEVWENSEMIVKVKEPLSSEYKYFRPGLIIFTFLHLAADKP